MAYTSHGHHIPGTLKGDGTVGPIFHCGGIEFCPRCKSEVESCISWRRNHDNEEEEGRSTRQA